MAGYEDLPYELVLQILECIIAERSCRLAPLASVCRLWQQTIEAVLFEEVSIYVTRTRILSGRTTASALARTIRGPRLRWLKKLRLIIAFYQHPWMGTNITDTQQSRLQVGTGFVDIIDSFVDTLSGWKRGEAFFDLEIHEEWLCGKYLDDYGSDLMSGPRRSIDCVRSIRHAEYKERYYYSSDRELSSFIASAMPNIPQEILIVFKDRCPDHLTGLTQKWDYPPKGVKSLSIRIPDQQKLVQKKDVIALLREASMQLKKLQVSHHVDIMDLCIPSTYGCPRPDLPTWPHLRSLSMPLSALRETERIAANEMAYVARAALRMPSLQQCELWCAGDKENKREGNFRYSIKGEYAHAVWKSNWGSDVSKHFFEEWRAVARQYTPHPLRTEVREMVSVDGRDMRPCQDTLPVRN